MKQNLRYKGKLVEDAETQELREKLARYETSLIQKDRENISLKREMKLIEDKDEIVTKLRDEIREYDKEITSLQHKLKYQPTQQTIKIDQTCKVINSSPIEDSEFEELLKLVDEGHQQLVRALREENKLLKDSIVQTQEAIKTSVNEAIKQI